MLHGAAPVNGGAARPSHTRGARARGGTRVEQSESPGGDQGRGRDPRRRHECQQIRANERTLRMASSHYEPPRNLLLQNQPANPPQTLQKNQPTPRTNHELTKRTNQLHKRTTNPSLRIASQFIDVPQRGGALARPTSLFALIGQGSHRPPPLSGRDFGHARR